jgi:hypothetical protein
MTIFFDILLLLTLVSMMSFIVSAKSPAGPEGRVGEWFIAALSSLFLGILVIVLAARGQMDFVPGGRAVQMVAAIGILVAFHMLLLAAFAGQGGVVQWLLIALPCLLFAGCVIAVHRESLPYQETVTWVARLLLGGTGITGLVIAVGSMSALLKEAHEREVRKFREEQELQEQDKREEIARFEKVGEDASLPILLGFMFSQNDQIRAMARRKIADFPSLDEHLIELLDNKSEDVIAYIGKVYEAPPKELAPAYGRMLERKLKSMEFIQYEEHAGNRELNLKEYFDGAQKLQQAGGDLRPQLRSWHELLLKCKGLDRLAASVKALL